jgi:hypothetical protein
MIEQYDVRKKIEFILIAILLLIAMVYGGVKAYPLLRGPSIVLYSPHDGDIVASTTFEVSGVVGRVKELTIQGRPVPIDTEGRFRELLVAMSPYTILTVTATDFYGKTVTRVLKVIPR